MGVIVSSRDTSARLTMSGRFDFEVHREFKEAYSGLLSNAQIREIEVELSRVDYLDSSALGMLILMNERVKTAGKSVTLISPSVVVAQVLDMANFNKIFTIKN